MSNISEELVEKAAKALHEEVCGDDTCDHISNEFEPDARAVLEAVADDLRAEAWDAGHRHPQKLGPDGCECAAHYAGECACGEYGNGELLSLAANPYRRADA